MDKLPKNFDWKTYLELNTDVKQDTETKVGAINHYLKYGVKEKRIYSKEKLPSDFDWKEYLKLNSDVKKNVFTKNESICHYLKYGIVEKRKYKMSKEPNVEVAVENTVDEPEHVDANFDDNEEENQDDYDNQDENDDNDDWDSGYDDEEMVEILANRELDTDVITNVIEHRLVGIVSEQLNKSV
jgi:hypothetical protein